VPRTALAPLKNARADGRPAPAEPSPKARRRRAPRKGEWPYGFSWFFFPEDFPTRRAARAVLEFTVPVGESEVNVFDFFILVCIVVSTLCLMIDYPLADPKSPVISAVRSLDTVFACIFIGEMSIKLLALPLFWGEGAYLWSSGCGWNWLDFIVVNVSILGFVGGMPPELKTLRILRAFRPLRVLKRAEALKNIVEAIFNSMKELGVLLLVFMLFLLIFALVFMMYLSGTLYGCSEENVWFHRDVGDAAGLNFTLPLCVLGGNGSRPLASAMVRGEWVEGSSSNGTWNDLATGACGVGQYAGFEVEWRRASPDTPLCVGRCDPFWAAPWNTTYAAPMDLCPRKYASTEELPHRCSDSVANLPGRNAFQESIGFHYIEKMQASYVMPCGGATEQSVADGDEPPAGPNSCRSRYCPVVDPGLVETCRRQADLHPHFCLDSCATDDGSARCQACKLEFRAACECPDFCRPLMKDGALCAEQGGSWDAMLSHNFDNVFNAMLLLIEISTTEGWVDAMYAACDTQWAPYIQPMRDATAPFWMFWFTVWVLFSFMFLMNLGVGIIVDKFMEMRSEGKDFISAAQLMWIKTRLSLQKKDLIFTLTNLHELSPLRRKAYDFIENPVFDSVIMGFIIFNTMIMATATFPEGESMEPGAVYWRLIKVVLNYIFAFVFSCEAVLKLYVLRGSYWKDSWNTFDFVCVMATIVGIVLTVVDTGINVSSVASVIRIFRIARLFKLLKYKALQNLNKLFKSMIISVAKLANVGIVAMLFLVLFSILGVSLFSTISQESDTHDGHGNFEHFINGFITLFRASTGEAWNEIMHDLEKHEGDWFREGSWCTPADLFDTTEKYEVLREKCLIAHPNACVLTFAPGWSPLPWLYWIGFTWFIGLVIMNVVIAVILEGYEETKSSDEAAIVKACKRLWGTKYDPNRLMTVPFPDAIRFIVEAIQVLQREGEIGGEPVTVVVPECDTGFGVDLKKFPLKFGKALDIKPVARVEFQVAARQVLRFATIVANEDKDTETMINELDQCDAKDDRRDVKKMRKLEAKDPALQVEGYTLGLHIAAILLQRNVRQAMNRTRRRRKRGQAARDAQGNLVQATPEGRQMYLRRAADAEAAALPIGVTPPAPG